MTLVTPPSGPDFDVTDYEALAYYRREPGYVVHDGVSGPASTAPTLPLWAASTSYKAGQEIWISAGTVAVAQSTHLSGSTYAADKTAGKWVEVAGGGTSSAATKGLIKRGVYIPAGSLDTWKAARDAATSQQVEVVGFGDSRLFGLADSGPNYSIFDRLRDRVRSALGGASADGGKGIFAGNESSMTGRDAAYEVNGFVSSTWTGVGDGFDTLVGQYYRSSASGEVLNLQGNGTRFKLWYTMRSNAGGIGVTIDGGTEQIIETFKNTGQTQAWQLFSGLTSGLHTVALRNVGGRLILPPSAGLNVTYDANTFSGTLTTGQTYYYKVTYHKAGTGETTGSVTQSASIPNSTTARTVTVILNSAQPGNDVLPVGFDYGVYRATSAAGPFQLLQYVTGGGGGVLSFRDDGSLTPGATIPSTNTAGRDSSTANLYIAAEFTFDTGIVWHKQATSGARLLDWFDPLNRAASNTFGNVTRAQAAVGIVQAATQTAGGYSWQQAQDATTAARRPKLALLYLGFNDMNSIAKPWNSAVAYTTSTIVYYGGAFWNALAGTTNVLPGSDATKWVVTQPSADLVSLAAGVNEFIRLARSAGADPVVITGEEMLSGFAPYWGGKVVETIRDIAVSNGAVWVDLLECLGTPNQWSTYSPGGGSPHLTKAGKIIQADFLWDNVLSPAAY